MQPVDSTALAASNWLVTGASRGIGAAIARRLAVRNCGLILHGRDARALEDLAGTCLNDGARSVRCRIADLSKPGEAAKLARDLLDADESIDGLVNNAGFAVAKDVIESTPDDLLHQIEVDMKAPLALTAGLLPAMIARRRGFILNVSSVAGVQAVPSQAVYAATKGFLLNFTIAVRHEVRGSGVHVTALCPGLTRTSFFDSAGIDLEKRFARIGRWHQAGDVATLGVDAVLRDSAMAVPGFDNRMSIVLQRFIPRRLVNGITQWIMQ